MMGMKNPTVLVMKNLMNIGKDLDNYWYNLDYDNDNIEPFF
jgi:hypothetical protein